MFVAVLDRALARQSGGTYLIRIEDTDQEREVAGAEAGQETGEPHDDGPEPPARE